MDYACGGSILDQNTILTASHCVHGRRSVISAARVSVHVGRIHLKEASEYTQTLGVQEIILHPRFSRNSFNNDIALIKLSSNITMNQYVQPVCLWTMDNKLDLIVGRNGTIVGFGKNEHDLVSDQLKQALVGVVDPLTCIKSDRTAFGIVLTSNMFCGKGQMRASACNGDSGGGMFFEISGKWFVRGLVSFTPLRGNTGLCDPLKYTAYTDVAQYLEWISQYIDQRVLSFENDVLDIDYAEKLRLFNFKTCGVKSSTVLNDRAGWTLPWLGFVKAPNEAKFRCIVTLISEWYAVGLADCFSNDGVEAFVVLGSNREYPKVECFYRNESTVCSHPSQTRRIQRVVRHPKFGTNNFADNIALIELLSPADTTQPNVKPICLPVTPELRTNANTHLSVASFSTAEYSTKNIRVDYVNSVQCAGQYAERKIELVLENKLLCAAIASKQDDQNCIPLFPGASLHEMKIFNNSERYFLRGYELIGLACRSQDPPVYNNIEAYIDWILYNMRYNDPEETSGIESLPENQSLQLQWKKMQQEPGNEKLRLFNMNTCGIPEFINGPAGRFIIFPWLVSIIRAENILGFDTLPPIDSVGVLISERYFLTNAHLVQQKAWWRSVVLGQFNYIFQQRCAGDTCFRAVEAAIRRIIVHPNYAEDPLSYNIALVELAEPANLLNPSIRPICMPFLSELQNQKPIEVVVASNELHVMKIKPLTVLHTTTCQRQLALEGFLISKQTVPWCAVDEDNRIQSLLLNAGAPLQARLQFDEDQRVFLRGINLRNNLPNELPYLPELFTNVDRFLEWIVDNMKGKEPNAQSKTDLTKATDRRINLPPIQYASKRKMFNFSNCGIMPSANESSNSYPTIPWLGFLYSNATNKTPKKCVVTLISEWYAVSLAACFSDNSKEHSILLDGKTRWGCIQSATCLDDPSKWIPVRQVIIHPQYDSVNHRNDIALIHLARALDTSDPNVKPICLPVLDEVRSYETSRLATIEVNAGSAYLINPNPGERYVESSECQKRWNDLAVNFAIDNSKICFSFKLSPNKQCFGLLIGSSLQTIQQTSSGERHFLRGILQIKPLLCELHYPVVYMDTEGHLDWIIDNMEEMEKVSNPFGLPYDLRETLLFY
ncbi:uncharacterized protein LOC120901254 [Anopheles arabiensis]|uniref:uncharacterized protein LOC120901254 n=1 Tax=Anopheles arabiensis TaxID=7173 RepID=UPI001AADC6E4|nr:uncharacterized protein LOC120901254 [Anopheles arabiensis]